MANFFNIAYPPNEDYIRFNGGKNSKIQKNIILDNQSPDCLNVIIDDDAVATRPGTLVFNTSSVGSFACDGFYTRHERNSTAETMCAWFGGSLHAITGTSTFTTIASAQSIYTGGTKVFAVEYQNNIFFGAGSANIPSKWNGTDFTRHGIYAPTTTMSVASAAGSNLSGLYRWAVAYVNSAMVEGNLSPFTVTFSAAATGVQLSSVPVAPQSYGVASRNIYRTTASGTVLYYAGSIANNTSTTYVDNTSDAGLGDEAVTDNNEPPNYHACIYHQDRIFMIGRYPGDNNDQVYYTDVGNPYVVLSSNFISIGDATSDTPQALGLWDNYLIVTGARGSTWMVYMPTSDDTNWSILRLRSGYGSKSPLGMFEALNFLIFPAVERDKFVGFGALSASGIEATAATTDVGAVGSDLVSNVIEDEMFAANETYLSNIASIVFKNKAYITMTTGNSTFNNRVFVFDFSTNGLQKSQKYTWIPWTGINAAQFTVYGGNLYYACSNAVGHVYRALNASYSDSGTAINSYFWTKEFAGQPQHSTWYKDWRFANLLYELAGNFNMGLTIRTDSDRGEGIRYDLDCSPGSSVWGSMVFGTDNWEPGRDLKDLKYPLGQFRGKRVQFKFSNNNTANQNFKVVGLNLTYNLKGRR
jgi:hypothetical protein